MAPPIETFPASELEERVNVNLKGNLRKNLIDLKKCEPLELVQYKCGVDETSNVITCAPVVRLFRRCVDFNKSTKRKTEFIMVETTDWDTEKKIGEVSSET